MRFQICNNTRELHFLKSFKFIFEAFFYLCNFELMKYLIVLFCALFSTNSVAQVSSDSLNTNSRYLEDQFYIGVTYNFLRKKAPENLKQRKLSYGVQAGFIKDIPLNSTRTFGLGIGVGLALNTYYSDLKAVENANDIMYTLETVDITRSKIETHLVEIPFQFRWRNSTPDEYKFWRVYTGVTFGYAVGARSRFISNNNDLKIAFNNSDVRRFQYGITLDLGNNSFNAHIHYSLTNLLNDNVSLTTDEIIELVPLRVGLIFYIL